MRDNVTYLLGLLNEFPNVPTYHSQKSNLGAGGLERILRTKKVVPERGSSPKRTFLNSTLDSTLSLEKTSGLFGSSREARKGIDTFASRSISPPRRVLPEGDFLGVPSIDEIGEECVSDSSYFFAFEDDAIEELCFLGEVVEEPEVTEQDFICTLTSLLNSLPHYTNVEIQSIKLQDRTRIPIHIVSFLYGERHNIFGEIFIKDYSNLNPLQKRKDTVLPVYLSKLGIPTATVIGFNPTEQEFDQRYAFLQPLLRDGVLMETAGNDDFLQIARKLLPSRLVENSLKVVKLMAKMHVLGTKNLPLLKSTYGLELEQTDYTQLIKERFTNQLGLNQTEETVALLKEFMGVYMKLAPKENNQRIYMQHGDFTLSQIRTGKTLDQYYLLDWELARKDALCAEDLAVLFLCVQREKPPINQITDEKLFVSKYLNAFSRVAAVNAPEFSISSEEFATQVTLETLRGHLYKLGDQVMMQNRIGESFERIPKAKHHLRMFCDTANYVIKTVPALESTVNALMKSVFGLVNASPQLTYLHNTV